MALHLDDPIKTKWEIVNGKIRIHFSDGRHQVFDSFGHAAQVAGEAMIQAKNVNADPKIIMDLAEITFMLRSESIQ